MRRLGGKPLKINNNSSGDEHRHGAVLINFDVPPQRGGHRELMADLLMGRGGG